jgi:hypothetical protein
MLAMRDVRKKLRTIEAAQLWGDIIDQNDAFRPRYISDGQLGAP